MPSGAGLESERIRVPEGDLPKILYRREGQGRNPDEADLMHETCDTTIPAVTFFK